MVVLSLVVVLPSPARAGGLVFTTLAWRNDPQGVQAVRFDAGTAQLQLVFANNAVGRGLEPTSAMCRRFVACVAAVNGDFFAQGEVVGDAVSRCMLLHTRQVPHEFASLKDNTVSSDMRWAGKVTLPSGTERAVNAVNSFQTGPDVVLYTSRWGRPTRQGTAFTDLVFRSPAGPNVASFGKSASLTFESGRQLGGTTVDAQHVVLSVRTLGAFAQLRPPAAVNMLFSSTQGCDIVGGHPIIVRDGTAAPVDPRDTAMFERHARSVLAHTYAGETLLLTVDGTSAAGHGATIAELVALLRRFHVITAINLDGGGSTTFVQSGRVKNHPESGSERPVSQSLVVIRP